MRIRIIATIQDRVELKSGSSMRWPRPSGWSIVTDCRFNGCLTR